MSAVTLNAEEQQIVYFDGSGSARYLRDNFQPSAVADMSPIARAVLVTRLREFAHAIEVEFS